LTGDPPDARTHETGTARKRVIGIDLGHRRIGVSVSDSRRVLASPHSVIVRSGLPKVDHKAIAALVRLGLESQESRKREFFKRLKENLGNDDPSDLDRLVDEFRTLILGR